MSHEPTLGLFKDRAPLGDVGLRRTCLFPRTKSDMESSYLRPTVSVTPDPEWIAVTQPHCPQCRAASPDIAAAAIRVAALTQFVRQATLELEELRRLLDVPHDDRC